MEAVKQGAGRETAHEAIKEHSLAAAKAARSSARSDQPDLLTRWIEIGAFNPLFRDHSDKGSLDQEPWVHGAEHEAIRRRYIETRYRLLPYIYTLAEEA